MTDGVLAGKRALIVGAGSGIGRAVCESFVEQGANVVALERDSAKAAQLQAELPSSVVVAGDATSPADNMTAVDTALRSFGGLDVLVNCVGIFDFYRGIGDLEPDTVVPAFDELFAVNVLTHLLAVRAALDPLRDSRGSIVLTTSTSGFFPGRGGVLYVSSKFAVRGLVVALAHELAPRIRVNGVAPGGTLGTDLRGPASIGLDDVRLGDRPDRESELRARTPLNIALTPADQANSYVFLASDQSRGMTGTFLHPDGGIGIKG